MTRRILHTQSDVAQLARYLEGLHLPLTVTVKAGADRSAEQNALIWKWNGEIAAQKGDETADEIHAQNKLRIGIPILREDDDFRELYDATIRPLPYERKLELMKGDLFAVTRIMSVKEMTRYLDAVFAEWTERGFVLTQPEASQ